MPVLNYKVSYDISGIIRRYHLEKHFPIENYGITGDQVKKAREPVIKDDNLKTLWKKALMEGFSGKYRIGPNNSHYETSQDGQS